MSGGRIAGRLVDCRRIGSQHLLRLTAPGWRPALAGQFAMLQPEDGRHFLPRAFSVQDQRGDTVSFLVSAVGPGTEELVETPMGGVVWVLGPLGNGFDLGALSAPSGASATSTSVDARHRLVIAAGGVGLAPFPLLLEQTVATRRADRFREVLVLLGFRDEQQAETADLFERLLAGLRAAGTAARLEIITENGSLGRAGLITSLLSEELRPGDRVAACGVHGMCGAVWDVCASLGVTEAWFSLEAPMACGIGSCHGCVVELAGGGFATVCRRGPVFRGEDIFGRTKPGGSTGSSSPAGGCSCDA